MTTHEADTTRSKKLEIVAVGSLLVASFLVRWPFRHVALIRDEGEYAHMGQEILRGAIPYLDVYNQKPPYAPYCLAVVQKLAGTSLEAIRLFTTLHVLVTVLVVYLLGRKLFGRAAGLWAAAAFAAMQFDQAGVWNQTSAETLQLLWAALAVYFWRLSLDSAAWRFPLLAGAAAAMACQAKQTGATLLTLLVLEPLVAALRDQERGSGRWIAASRAAGLALVGFVVILLIPMAYFASHGALPAYFECVWRNNFQYVAQRHGGFSQLPSLARNIVAQVARFDIGFWVLGVAATAFLSVSAKRKGGRELWLLLLATGAAALGTGGLFLHYYLPLTLPLALGVGAASAWLLRQLRQPSLAVWPPAIGRKIVLVGLVALCWVGPALHNLDYARLSAGQFAEVENVGGPFGVSAEVARYVAARTAPGEKILVVGSEPQIYYYAERPAASRMAIMYPMTGPYGYATALREQFLNDIARGKPRYVIVVEDPGSLSEWPARGLDFLRQVQQATAGDYAVEARLSQLGEAGRRAAARAGDFILILRRNEPPTNPVL